MNTDNNTNPTTAKHQLVSPEGFLRPVEVPEGVTKLVIYVGGDREKIETILRVCEGINSVRGCMDLDTLQEVIVIIAEQVEYIIFNYRKNRTFTYLSEVRFYERNIQKEKYYEVSYDLFIEKLRRAERELLFRDYLENLGQD